MLRTYIITDVRLNISLGKTIYQLKGYDIKRHVYDDIKSDIYVKVGEVVVAFNDKRLFNKSTRAPHIMEHKEELCIRRNGKTLIHVAPQAPFNMDDEINEEYRNRLDIAISKYNELKDKGVEVQIHVMGSKRVNDATALGLAGKSYLVTKGIPTDDIICKPCTNCYTTEDEVAITAALYRELREFGDVIVVCAPAQIMRIATLFIDNLIMPEFIIQTVPSVQRRYMKECYGELQCCIRNNKTYIKDKTSLREV